ncbi:MAG: hypothetical protein K5644_01370 [Lachnospiraceae bacterium]|nr:hypothetical protein [Lachnospiraceae bacterium]
MSLFGNKTIYFIDSENVNDNWIDTITDMKRSDEIRVFYTEKSANVSCENISKIAGGDVNLNWIKCFTGQNALDFQLVTDLGYSVAKGMRDTFIIISNDKGYDAVVNYWVIKGVNVSRVGVEVQNPKKPKKRTFSRTSIGKGTPLNPKTTNAKAVKKVPTQAKATDKAAGKAAANKSAAKSGTKQTTTKSTAKTSDKTANKTAGKANATKTSATKPADSSGSLWKRAPGNDDQYMAAVGRCISIKELNRFHMVLTNLFGQEKGTEYYHKLKDDKELRTSIAKKYISEKKLRLDYIVKMFLAYNKKGYKDAADIINIVNNKKCDSLNTFYKLLTEKFKEDKGRDYYNLYKGIFSILKDI